MTNRNGLQRLVVGLLLCPLAASTAYAQGFASADVTCRGAIARYVRSLTDKILNAQGTCHKRRRLGNVGSSVDCNSVASSSFPSDLSADVTTAAAKVVAKIVSTCAGASTVGANAYDTCPNPCDSTVPSIASYTDVANCLSCLAKADAAGAVLSVYGTPALGAAYDSAAPCQEGKVFKGLRRYLKTRMKEQASCQKQEDKSDIGSTDCSSADLKGKITSAAFKLSEAIAQCSATDLSSLTSCAASVSGEQLCVLQAAGTLADGLFAEIFPERPTPTPSISPTISQTPTITLTRTSTNTPTSTGTRTPSSTPTTTSNCISSNFLNVSGAAGPGGSYSSLAPSLSVSCGASTVTVTSNGIPTYEYVAMTPNGLQAKSYNFTFPRSPSVAASTTNIPLLGQIAVAVNGIPIYGVNEGAMPASDAYGDPIAANIMDQCGSHSAPQGTFHNHKLIVKCLLQSAVSSSQPWNNADPSSSVASPIVGYAFDGFPIYGPYECTDVGCSSVQTMLSGWDSTGYQAGTAGCTTDSACSSGYCTDVMIGGSKTTACVPKTCIWSNNGWSPKNGAQYLDQCNGHYGPNGDYHYHTTDTFPYTLGCYRGTATSNGGSGTPPGGSCAAVPTAAPTFTPTP